MPALFTRMSILPHRAITASVILATESSSATSVPIAIASWPREQSRSTVSRAFVASRSAAATRAPAPASASTNNLPNPPPAPVTIATSPASRSSDMTCLPERTLHQSDRVARAALCLLGEEPAIDLRGQPRQVLGEGLAELTVVVVDAHRHEAPDR